MTSLQPGNKAGEQGRGSIRSRKHVEVFGGHLVSMRLLESQLNRLAARSAIQPQLAVNKSELGRAVHSDAHDLPPKGRMRTGNLFWETVPISFRCQAGADSKRILSHVTCDVQSPTLGQAPTRNEVYTTYHQGVPLPCINRRCSPPSGDRAAPDSIHPNTDDFARVAA